MILKNYENKLIHKNFDEILNFLTEIPKSELFLITNDKEDLANIKEGLKFSIYLKKDIGNIKITNSLLKNLEKDYETCISKISQKLEEFKHHN